MSSDIFMSYAREDLSKAMELARILETDGWSVWWDREIKPGQDFEIEIDTALAAARAVVVLWSRFSVDSEWVRTEAHEARELNKLIPVHMDDCRIPLSYRSLNTIDLRCWPDQLALVELSTFKSAISRTLLEGVTEQRLRKPQVADAMTLSVRVASRVAEMVGAEKTGAPDRQIDGIQLAVERCIADICLDLLVATGSLHAARVEAGVSQLGKALTADHVVSTRVDFSAQTITAVTGIDGQGVDRTLDARARDYVNEYCTMVGDANLSLVGRRWPRGLMLCLPLREVNSEREFAWFLAEEAKPEWTMDLEHRLIQLSQGLRTRNSSDA